VKTWCSSRSSHSSRGEPAEDGAGGGVTRGSVSIIVTPPTLEFPNGGHHSESWSSSSGKQRVVAFSSYFSHGVSSTSLIVVLSPRDTVFFPLVIVLRCLFLHKS
jgi:hypothetical protein